MWLIDDLDIKRVEELIYNKSVLRRLRLYIIKLIIGNNNSKLSTQLLSNLYKNT